MPRATQAWKRRYADSPTNPDTIAAAVASGEACAGCRQVWAAGDVRVPTDEGEMHPACAKGHGFAVEIPKRHATFNKTDLFA